MKTLYFEHSESGTKVYIDADTAELTPVVEDTNKSINALKQIKDRLWEEYLKADDYVRDKILIETDIIDNCLAILK